MNIWGSFRALPSLARLPLPQRGSMFVESRDVRSPAPAGQYVCRIARRQFPCPGEQDVCSIERAVKEKAHPTRAAGNNFWRRAAVSRAPGASSSVVFRPTVFIVLTGHNRLMSSNADSHGIDRFGCFLRYLPWCVSLTMVLFVTLGPP